jgi:hypothetical protein
MGNLSECLDRIFAIYFLTHSKESMTNDYHELAVISFIDTENFGKCSRHFLQKKFRENLTTRFSERYVESSRVESLTDAPRGMPSGDPGEMAQGGVTSPGTDVARMAIRIMLARCDDSFHECEVDVSW